jgi:hypothetical protein
VPEDTSFLITIEICIRGCIEKFPDWPLGAKTANGTALWHKMQLYHYFVSQSSEFCCHSLLCCFSTSVYCCKRIFRYQLNPETFGYTLVLESRFMDNSSKRIIKVSQGLRIEAASFENGWSRSVFHGFYWLIGWLVRSGGCTGGLM